MNAAVQLDPWFTGTNEPTFVTHDDRITAGIKAMNGAWHRTAQDQMVSEILDAAYPIVITADEIEDLPAGTVIISETGNVYKRSPFVAKPSRTSGGDVGGREVWEKPGANESGSKIHRLSSQQLAVGGVAWTVVHQVAV